MGSEAIGAGTHVFHQKNGQESDFAQERARDPAKAQIESKNGGILLPFIVGNMPSMFRRSISIDSSNTLSRHGRSIATGPTGPTKKMTFGVEMTEIGGQLIPTINSGGVRYHVICSAIPILARPGSPVSSVNAYTR